MAKSAGILLFRQSPSGLQILLVHPGGPFWSKKDQGAWSIPKGEIDGDEPARAAALRELTEETGWTPVGELDELLPLEPLKQSGGKVVFAWALAFDGDPASLKSNTFTMEWPPKSGRQQEFPEIDRAEWFGIAVAREKIVKGQAPFIDQLLRTLGGAGAAGPEG